MKKGFTLMELLFVLLLIALVVSFAVPVIRSVRYDVYNARAKSALKKLAEARRSYYQQSKGSDISDVNFIGSAAKNYAAGQCSSLAASGVPGNRTASAIDQLFACRYLDWKDFVDVPYTFYVCSGASSSCSGVFGGNAVFVGAVGTNAQAAGSKYSQGYFMLVGPDMQLVDNKE